MRDLVGKRQICKADMEKAKLWQEFDERIMFPMNVHRGIMFLKLICEGGHYAGKNHGPAYIALQYGSHWGCGSNWNAGNKPHLWKTRDRLLHRMNRLVWYPALISIALLGLAVYFSTVLKLEEGLPLTYLYVGATLPVALLLLRQALDFSYKEELVINTLADYVEQMRTWAEEIPAGKKTDPVLQEEVIDRITSSIKQTAASGSHFSKMLTPEEEKIMREIIREFMA